MSTEAPGTGEFTIGFDLAEDGLTTIVTARDGDGVTSIVSGRYVPPTSYQDVLGWLEDRSVLVARQPDGTYARAIPPATADYEEPSDSASQELWRVVRRVDDTHAGTTNPPTGEIVTEVACPCGGPIPDERRSSPHCGPDCEPIPGIRGAETDNSARWRPGLESWTHHEDLELLYAWPLDGGRTLRVLCHGRRYACNGEVRLDDGNRFVGVHVPLPPDDDEAPLRAIADARLPRLTAELTDPAKVVEAAPEPSPALRDVPAPAWTWRRGAGPLWSWSPGDYSPVGRSPIRSSLGDYLFDDPHPASMLEPHDDASCHHWRVSARLTNAHSSWGLRCNMPDWLATVTSARGVTADVARDLADHLVAHATPCCDRCRMAAAATLIGRMSLSRTEAITSRARDIAGLSEVLAEADHYLMSDVYLMADENPAVNQLAAHRHRRDWRRIP